MAPKMLFAALLMVATLTGSISANAATPENGFVPVSNGRLYYEAAGSGPTVVLIHGNAGDHRHWNNQFDALASHYRVIRYDVRGYGQSSDPVIGSPYSNHSDLESLLDYLDVGTAHVVGWSFGSGIAFDFATAHSDRVISLTSVGPWVNGHSSKAINELYEQALAVADEIEKNGASAGPDAFVDLILAKTIFDKSADDFMRRVGSDTSFWTFANPSQTVALNPSAASRLSNVTFPILVVTAEHDLPACRDMADFIVSEAQYVRRIDMVGTGHLMHIEKPKEFNANLLEFLAESH